MSAHSPGPWSVETDEDGRDRIVDALGGVIAEIAGCSRGTNPNAHLLGAATDLLDACELARSQLSCNCCFPACNTCYTIRQLEQAIKKARGKK